MIPHQVQESIVTGELSRAVQGTRISGRLALFDELDTAVSGRPRKHLFITRLYHHRNLVHLRAPHLLENDAQDALFPPVPVDQCLQWKGALAARRRCNYSLLYFHQ